LSKTLGLYLADAVQSPLRIGGNEIGYRRF
jgi:hypothetical protein